MTATRDRIRIVDTTVLSDNWYVLKKVTFDYQRRDGTGSARAAKPTTAATARPSCCTIPRPATSCSRASSACPRSSTATTAC